MKNRIEWAARLVLSVTFVVSALTKLLPIEVFELTLMQTGIFSWSVVPWVSRLIVAAELAAGLCLLQPFGLKRIVIPFTFGLILIFSVHLTMTIALDGPFSGNCGCFGEWIPMSPAAALIKNVVLLGLLVYVFLAGENQTGRVVIPSGLAAVAVVSVFSLVPVVPYSSPDPHPTDSHESSMPNLTGFTSFEGAPSVHLTEGPVVVALFSLDCEHCMEVAGKIGRLKDRVDLPPVYVLFLGEPEEVPHFFDVAQTRFPYRLLDPMTFFPLLDEAPAPPRVVFLLDGRMVGDWHYANFDIQTFEKTVLLNR